MDRVGTWETSRRPQSPRRSRATTGSRGDEAVGGRREESDGCVVPMKPRTKPTTNRQRREWREGGRSKERRAATHAPDSEPDRRVTKRRAYGLEVHGLPSSYPR